MTDFNSVVSVLNEFQEDDVSLAEEVCRLRERVAAVRELLGDETWHVGGAWGDYGEPVVLARNVAERLGVDYERDREDQTSGFAANYAEAVSAAELAEQECDVLRKRVATVEGENRHKARSIVVQWRELIRLRDGIREVVGWGVKSDAKGTHSKRVVRHLEALLDASHDQSRGDV